jgi:16S rRNA (guanine966-N2)-methyltransferase
VRVIAGTRGGRKIRTLPGMALRPTLDRVRESVFGILRDEVEGAGVLDLYAGTGALGIEALSRGAASAVFVDSDARALAVLRENLAALGLEPHARIVRGRLPSLLRPRNESALPLSEPIDIIFADPPYRTSLARETVACLLEPEWFPGWRCLVVETEREADLSDVAGAGLAADRRVYGDTAVTFLRPAAGGAAM